MQEWTEGKTENKSLENYLLNVPFSGVRQVALWIMVSLEQDQLLGQQPPVAMPGSC